MDINYELYKVFYYVASTLSFSEASKQLFISQSAVSQSIKTLERKLDQVLFIRSTKKVQLTPEGEILLRHVEPAMNLIKRGEAQLLDSASTGGQIRIGAQEIMGELFYKIKQFPECCTVNLHRRVLSVKNDAVFIIIYIRRVLKSPLAVVDGQRNDPVVLSGRMVDAAGIAFIFHTELAFRISTCLCFSAAAMAFGSFSGFDRLMVMSMSP